MTSAVSPQTGTCPEYERLLQECRTALEIWQRRRVQLYRDGVKSRKMSIELEQLQAKYVKSYARWERHEQSCQLCQYVSKIGGLDFESMSHAVMAHKAASGR